MGWRALTGSVLRLTALYFSAPRPSFWPHVSMLDEPTTDEECDAIIKAIPCHCAETFTEFLCDFSTGANINAGDKTSAASTTTNGSWSTVTNIFLAASGTPFAGVVAGDFASVYIDGATTAVYIARVVTVTSSASITLSATAKSGTAPSTSATTRSCTVGGMWKGPNSAEAFPFNFVNSTMTDASADLVRVNFRNTATYTITAAMTHTVGTQIVFQGCTTSPGDLGKAIIDGGTSGASFQLLGLGVNGSNYTLRDMIFQNNGATGSAVGVATVGNRTITFERCVVNSVRGAGFNAATSAGLFVECEAYACNQNNGTLPAGFNLALGGSAAIRCVSHDNTGNAVSGFILAQSTMCLGCIADTNGLDGFQVTASNSAVQLNGCVAYGNTGAGIKSVTGGVTNIYVENCVLESNTSFGVNNSVATTIMVMRNCFTYSNNGGTGNAQTSGTIDDYGTTNLSASAFTAPTTGNFTLNNTAGGGGSVRAAGRGTFTQTATSYTGSASTPDGGACQVSDITSTDPGIANVKSGVTYNINGSALTGTLAPPVAGLTGAKTPGGYW